MNQNLVSANAAAERIGVSAATVIRWAQAGKITGVRLAGKRGTWVLDADQVDAIAVAHRAYRELVAQ
jgi:excisionase family DNA binding protein